MKEFNVYSMDCLNRKAINTISSIHHLFSGMKSGQSKVVPMARVGKSELTFKDFESLFGTYAKYRCDNELREVGYNFTESSIKTSTFEIGADNVNVETITIYVGSEVSKDVFNVIDIPTEYKKRDGAKEKAKTEANKKKANTPSNPSEPNPSTPSEPSPSIPSPSEEIDNEEKTLQKNADEFNGEVVKDIQEVTMRRIGLIFGVDFKDMTKEQKTSLADALNDFVTMLDKGSVM